MIKIRGNLYDELVLLLYSYTIHRLIDCGLGMLILPVAFAPGVEELELS